MKTIKLPHLLFSLAVIAALVTAAIPAAPAYALGSGSAQTTVSAADSTPAVNVIVCRNIVRWRDGHRIVVRVCKRVHRPDTQ